MAATSTADLPTLRYAIGSTVVTGDRLGNVRQVRPGHGTYAKGGHVYASIVGILNVERQQQEQSNDNDQDDDNKDETKQVKNDNNHYFICTVGSSNNISTNCTNSKPLASLQVLKVGQKIMGKIMRLSPQNAIVEISVAENVGALQEVHEGIISTEDVIPTASSSSSTDSNIIQKSFQPGDIIVARILSLGDARRYFLSTAEQELGVVRAISAKSGKLMVPIIGWNEMQCPETQVKETRKCAKPPKIIDDDDDNNNKNK